MESGKHGAEPGQHIPATAVHEYLKSYAYKFDLVPLIRLKTTVISAEHDEIGGGWTLTVRHHGETNTIFTRRLIVASGCTSEPNLPKFVGDEEFHGPIFHGRDFGNNAETVRLGQRATVYGWTKYAWDAVYAYAAAGAEVHWIIRPNGHGPCWMTPAYVTPLKKRVDFLPNVRLFTWFSPCIWGSEDGHSWIRGFLHGTWLGRFITNLFWKLLALDVLSRCQFYWHPEVRKLKPKLDIMFAGASFSILNYETDFFDYVKSGQVKVHVADVDRLSEGKVHLSDNTCFESDSILVHTGWKRAPAIKFLPEGLDAELGLPHERRDELKAQGLGSNDNLLDRADREVLSRFPSLRGQPQYLKNYVPLSEVQGVARAGTLTKHNSMTPFMLHRLIVPASARFLRHRDMAFCGMAMDFSTPILAHIQSLWTASYMSGSLSRDATSSISEPGALEKLQYQTVLINRFGKWRYPVDWGNRSPSFIFDAVPYYDMLLRDLGLALKRKRGFFSDLFEGYEPGDYRDTTLEWMAKQRMRSES
ncbi:Flavin monooxygenase-like protein [Metarhizium rileyi]|uniref:Flavin monooxygenase-like protein n=1 Tax=Metarhizium rileyi (strain RCEF 4871) TaxID=1649241 RepID=A0A166VWU2_METRR|nr:Flavin monooxygenase-like protein [Metarhizium rileyi RCEF 4871]